MVFPSESKEDVSERWIDQSTQKQGAMLGGVDYGYLWQASEYSLEFDSSATSAVVVKGDGIRLVSPNEETIDLFPHRQVFFTGTCRYGPLTVVFEYGPNDALSLTVYSNFSRFRFEKW